MVDIEELKKQFLNAEFDSKNFVLDAANLLVVAKTSGETRAQFIDAEHADFQATPAFLCSLASGRHLPIDFPALGGIPMDGGKAVECFAPIRAGQPITGKSHLHDIYDKQGRSGRMIFIVVRMEIVDAEDKLLAISDSRLVIREKPAA
ncbi:MAG: MaoC family dehydratase N-terminal domain-containing protein [Pseudomonadales bacterium]|nr:MaoC family dehydratase N-terminal domain-containing protein [Pseudomonadales bacterium]